MRIAGNHPTLKSGKKTMIRGALLSVVMQCTLFAHEKLAFGVHANLWGAKREPLAGVLSTTTFPNEAIHIKA